MGKFHDLVKQIEEYHDDEESLRMRYDWTSTFTLSLEDAKQLVEDLQKTIIVAETATAEYRAYQSAKWAAERAERAKNEADND
jgi:hypothetical protein